MPKFTGRRLPKFRQGLLPRYMRWQMDVDYAESLPPEERAWLHQFLDEYYRAERRYDERLHDLPAINEAMRRKRCAERDVHSRNDAVGTLRSSSGRGGDSRFAEVAALPYDQSPTPGYLEDRSYREVREELRALIDREQTPEVLERVDLLQTYLLSLAASDEAGPDEVDS